MNHPHRARLRRLLLLVPLALLGAAWLVRARRRGLPVHRPIIHREAGSHEVQLRGDSPVIGNVAANPLMELAAALPANAAPRLRMTWFDNGMDMQDSGTLLYDRTTHTLSYGIDFVGFATGYRRSYLFTGVNDAMLHRAAAYVRTLNRSESSYPNGFLDELLRFGARKRKRFDVTTPPKS